MTFLEPKATKRVTPAPGVPFFIPKPTNPVGACTPLKGSSLPKLFSPLTIKNMTIQNRIGVSPMVTYTASPEEGPELGMPNEHHLIHYASMAMRGPGVVIVEGTCVSKYSRVSPYDPGLWTDEQALGWKKIVDVVHSQGGKIGVQLGHGGRKSSSVPLLLFESGLKPAYTEDGGWHDQKEKIWGPSEVSFSEKHGFTVPTEMTKEMIKQSIEDHRSAARRALDIAGFDFVEIHAAHGFLINTFLTSTCNKRTDEYGGSFENRIRFLLEIVDAVKDDEHPLFVRISGSELAPHIEGSWTVEDSVELCKHLAAHGVDVVDVSSGGININAERRRATPGYQVPLAAAIKKELGDKIVVATVGKITSSDVASMVVENGDADMVLVGRGFLRNPGLVCSWADEMGVRIQTTSTVGWPFGAY